jgi:hypothetical protein
MRSFFARAMLRKFSKRYGYDVSCLDYMLKQSPAAFFKFAGLVKASAHREVVPVDASFAAMALQMGRLFPMMKLALGYARECRRVSVDGQQVDVDKQAA